MKRILIALLLMATPAMAQIGQNGFMNAASTDCTTANSCVELQSPANSGSVTFQLTGTFVGTVQFEGTVDGNTWVAMAGQPMAGGTAATSATAAGAWRFGAAGLIRARVRTSAYTSGTVQVRLQSSLGTANTVATSSGSASDVNIASVGGNAVTTTVPVSGTVTVTDGAGALNTIVDSGTLTAVTSITNPVTITDGAGALNTIVDSGTLTAVTAITNPVTVTSAQTGSGTATGAIRVELPTNGTGVIATVGTITNPVTITDGAGALNTIVDSGTLTAVTTVGTITNPVTVTDGAGALNVIVDSSALPTGASNAVAQASTTSGQTGTMVQGAVTTADPSYTNGQTSPLNMNTSGQLRVAVQSGNLSNVSTIGTSVTPGTGATNLGKAEDAVAGSGDTGVAILAVAQATPTATAADGDYIAPKTNANGVLWSQDIATGANAATKPANSEQAGAAGVNAEQTAVTNGQLTNLVADLVGKLIVLPYANPENFVQGVTAAITDTTSTSVIASAGGSLRNYITHCSISNSHATVGTFVKILDGATIIDEIYAAAAGGGASLTYPVPLKGTAATAINAQPVTTGANVIVACNGYKGL